jgi:hypothetical protein
MRNYLQDGAAKHLPDPATPIANNPEPNFKTD